MLNLKWLFELLGKKKIGYNPEDKQQIATTMPSPDDKRDYISALPKVDLPKSHFIDNSEVKYQGRIGSCYAFSICSAIEMMNKNMKNRPLNLSELFLWYYTHVGNRPENGGYIRDALKFAQKRGVALERYCPYRVSDWNKEPSWAANFSAGYFKIKEYHRIHSKSELKRNLVKGFPVIFGMKIYSDYLKTDGKGIIQTPAGGYRGGHAMDIYGYSDKGFHILNSWGFQWGKRGRGILSYSMYDKYVFEAWRITPSGI